MLANKLNGSGETVRRTSVKDFSARELCVGIVLKRLSEERKFERMSVIQDYFDQAEGDPTIFDRTITGDKSRIFQYDPETKKQRQQRLSRGTPRPKKA